MIKLISNLFRKPSASSIARRDLEEAQRQGLAHRAAAEYHQSQSDYHDNLVKRLRLYLKEEA